MAANTHLSAVAVNACLDNALNPLNGGSLKIYDGSRPANPDAAITTQNLLVSLTLSSAAFSAASGGSKTAASITSGTASKTGTAAWFRAFKSDGTTAVIDGSVAHTGADLNLSSTTITSGDTVTCTSWVPAMAQ